jgi:hypothetical protein
MFHELTAQFSNQMKGHIEDFVSEELKKKQQCPNFTVTENS